MNRTGLVSLVVLALAAVGCASAEDLDGSLPGTETPEEPSFISPARGSGGRSKDPDDRSGNGSTGGYTHGTGGSSSGTGGTGNAGSGGASEAGGANNGGTGSGGADHDGSGGESTSETGGTTGAGGRIGMGGASETGGNGSEDDGSECAQSFGSLSSLIHARANGDVALGLSQPGLPEVALLANVCALAEISGGLLVDGDVDLLIAGRKIALADVDLKLLYDADGMYWDMKGSARVSLSNLTGGLIPPSPLGEIRIDLASLRNSLCDQTNDKYEGTCIVTGLIDQGVGPLLGTVAKVTREVQIVLDGVTGTTKLLNANAAAQAAAIITTDGGKICGVPYLLQFASATIPATAGILNGNLVPGSSAVPAPIELASVGEVIAHVTADEAHGLKVTAEGTFLLDTGSLPANLGLLAHIPVTAATVTTSSDGIVVTGKVRAAVSPLIGVKVEADVVVKIACDGKIASISLKGGVAVAGVALPLDRTLVISDRGIVMVP